MVFYRGRAHNGSKTKWKMNEYRAFEDVGTIDPGSAPKVSIICSPRKRLKLLVLNDVQHSLLVCCSSEMNSACAVCTRTRVACGRSTVGRPWLPRPANSRAQNEVSSNGGNCSGYKRARSQDSSSADDELDGSNPLLQGGDIDLKMLEEFDWDKLDWV